jgi:hypothetical protein
MDNRTHPYQKIRTPLKGAFDLKAPNPARTQHDPIGSAPFAIGPLDGVGLAAILLIRSSSKSWFRSFCDLETPSFHRMNMKACADESILVDIY